MWYTHNIITLDVVDYCSHSALYQKPVLSVQINTVTAVRISQPWKAKVLRADGQHEPYNCNIITSEWILLLSDFTVFRSNVLICRFLGKSALKISYSHHPCVAVCVCVFFCVNVCCQVAKILMKTINVYRIGHLQINSRSPVFLLLELDLHFHGNAFGKKAWYDTCSVRYLQPNDNKANVVLRDLDLNFQGHK